MHHAVASLSARTARLLSWLAEPYPVPLLLVLCASDKSQVLQSRAGQGRAQQSRAGRASPPKAASTAGAVGNVLPAGAAALRGRAGRWLTGFRTREVTAEVWAPGR